MAILKTSEFDFVVRLIGFSIAVLISLPAALAQDANVESPLRPAAEQNEAGDATKTPAIKRIVLYNSGLAQVVRGVEVDGSKKVEVAFDRDQIDDVLKSLVFDAEGGGVESVQYQPAPKKSDTAAAKFAAPLTVAQLLQKYRGEPVSMKLEREMVSGRIVGVETRVIDANEQEFVTLMSDDGLSAWRLADVQSFQFDRDASCGKSSNWHWPVWLDRGKVRRNR